MTLNHKERNFVPFLIIFLTLRAGRGKSLSIVLLCLERHPSTPRPTLTLANLPFNKGSRSELILQNPFEGREWSQSFMRFLLYSFLGLLSIFGK